VSRKHVCVRENCIINILQALPEWWVAGVVICLVQGADLHMAQLMPLPLTVSCFSKIQIGFTVLVPTHQVVPDKGLLNVCCFRLYFTLF